MFTYKDYKINNWTATLLNLELSVAVSVDGGFVYIDTV